MAESGGLPASDLILASASPRRAELLTAAGIPFEIRPVTREEALGADEMWLSSSTKEVLAVTTVDGRPFAGGRPGPVFKRVHAAFQAGKR